MDGRPEAGKDLAATYSRGSYTTTTIGKAAFDGRVREGIGSGRSFMAAKKIVKRAEGLGACPGGAGPAGSVKTIHRRDKGAFSCPIREFEIRQSPCDGGKRSSRTAD